MIVRGNEVGPGSGLEEGFPLASGFVVPAGARLQLQVWGRIEDVPAGARLQLQVWGRIEDVLAGVRVCLFLSVFVGVRV
jgi:hypothetical protein